MKAININWDADGDVKIRQTLPNEIEIPDELTEGMDKEDFDYDEICSYLSDQTGYCLYGFEISD